MTEALLSLLSNDEKEHLLPPDAMWSMCTSLSFLLLKWDLMKSCFLQSSVQTCIRNAELKTCGMHRKKGWLFDISMLLRLYAGLIATLGKIIQLTNICSTIHYSWVNFLFATRVKIWPKAFNVPRQVLAPRRAGVGFCILLRVIVMVNVGESCGIYKLQIRLFSARARFKSCQYNHFKQKIDDVCHMA